MAKSRTPPIRLAGNARRSKKFRSRMDKAGFALISLWAPKQYLDLATQRGRPLNLGKHAIIRAALEVGFRYLTTSAIQLVENRYRQVVGYPVAPQWFGSPFDPELRGDPHKYIKHAQAARLRYAEERKARKAARK